MLTLDQIRRAGNAALARDLGPVGMIRFLQQFETGSGDYTQDRHQWLDPLDLETVIAQIRQRPKPATQ
jgi:hypothetical protein